MTHLLDNPIWQALVTGNASLAHGTTGVKYLDREVGFFAGLPNNSHAELLALHALIPAKSRVILFVPEPLPPAVGWQVTLQKPLLQMVYLHPTPPARPLQRLEPLQQVHVPAILGLTAMTNPGPFLARTIAFGNYEGVFAGEALVAMAGQRLQPGPYTEISAVCTHPDHTGKGYAAALVQSQVRHILGTGRIPFLHLFPDNTAAYALYKKLGFETRRELWVYALERQD